MFCDIAETVETDSPYAAQSAPTNLDDFLALLRNHDEIGPPVVDADLWEEIFGQDGGSSVWLTPLLEVWQGLRSKIPQADWILRGIHQGASFCLRRTVES
jgi:hypothetical protein